MSEATLTAESETGLPPQSLLARLIGVMTSPKATFVRLVAAPKVAGALIALMIVGAIVGPGTFMLTERGKQATIDLAVQRAEQSGRTLTPEAQAQLEKMAPLFGYFAIGSTSLFFAIALLIEAGLLYLVFTFGTGGAATFKQVMAVVTHTGVIGLLGVAFTTIMAFVQGTISTNGTSPANFGALLPMLDDTSFLAKLLGLIDLFRVWSLITLAIGLGVLYKKKTGTIAMVLFAIYGVIIVCIAYFTSGR